MDFISIDFETATSERHSPCEIGLTFVEQSKVIATKSWLIKPMQYPNFDSFNVYIHGIEPQHVANEKEFKLLWDEEIKELVEGKFLIAHNASFDFSVLRRTLEAYNIPYPSLQYACSYIMSKQLWSGLISYNLGSLCYLNSITTTSHRAGPDSLACAQLVIKAFNQAEVVSIEEIPIKLKTSIGSLFTDGHRPSQTKRLASGDHLSDLVGDPSKINVDCVFYGKTIVFTGTLSSMARIEAQQLIADIGGVNGKDITQSTDFLVVGQQDFRKVGEDGMSNKQEKAQKLLAKGSRIEVISEVDFLRNI